MILIFSLPNTPRAVMEFIYIILVYSTPWPEAIVYMLISIQESKKTSSIPDKESNPFFPEALLERGSYSLFPESLRVTESNDG